MFSIPDSVAVEVAEYEPPDGSQILRVSVSNLMRNPYVPLILGQLVGPQSDGFQSIDTERQMPRKDGACLLGHGVAGRRHAEHAQALVSAGTGPGSKRGLRTDDVRLGHFLQHNDVRTQRIDEMAFPAVSHRTVPGNDPHPATVCERSSNASRMQPRGDTPRSSRVAQD